MKTAIVPGSFDPMTLGHLELVKKALGMFDRVIVALLINPDKEYMFPADVRKKAAELTVSGLDRVEVVSYDGYLVDLAREKGARFIVKGARNGKDFCYEKEMAEINSGLYPDAQTIIIPSYGKFDGISSTTVRRRLIRNRPITGYMVPEAAKYIKIAASKIDLTKYEQT